MVDKEREWIQTFVPDLYISIFGPPGVFMEELKDAIEKLNKEGWKDVEISLDGYEGHTMEFEGSRLETDREYERRLKEDETEKECKAKQEAKRAEKEYKLYERLKKKYGDL